MAGLLRILHQHFSVIVHVFLIVLFALPSLTISANNPLFTKNSFVDRQALLSFKLQISDPLGALASWHNGSANFCNWQGITCSKKHTNRVIALDLHSKGLVGQIPISIANLSFLTTIDLSDNHLHSAIPYEIGGLKRLRNLNLSVNSLDGMIPAALSSLSSLEEISLWNNSLTGEIPSNLSRCSNLKFIHFSSNKIQGRIPSWIGTIPALQVLILSGNNLVGNIPDSLGTTSSLTYVNLGQNSLSGGLPHNITISQSLQSLVLPYNSLSGRIPPELFNSSSLWVLDLTSNNFTRAIPSVSTVSSPLFYLTLGDNSLSGSIPISLANFSSLSMLYLSDNNLVGGIPDSLRMLNLERLDISINELSGLVPYCIYNMSSLTFLSMGNNSFSGKLPWNIGLLLPSISTLILQANRFEGPIPASLVNASSLEVLDLGVNSFQGLIPKLGTLAMLKELDIGMNHLEEQDWSSLSSLTNCSNLAKLLLDDNKFKGSLPESVGNFTINMNWLWLSKNNFSGSIPSSIGNLKNLTLLYADQNQLTGSIPSTIGNLDKLGSLSLARNKLTGVIPNSIGNLDQVEELYLDNNELEGPIPSTLEGCKNLLILNLSSNSLDGNIPIELFRLSSLSRGLDLSHNLFSGSIPSQVGSLINLGQLYLSGNLLSGKVPSSLGQCVLLQSLKLDQNSLDGAIPDSFRNLKGIEKMDLSQNQLSGRIPSFFESYTSLQYLNLSFNDFTGPVPIGSPFNSTSEVSLQGNKMLCALTVIHGLPPCLTFNSSGKGVSYILKIVLPLGVFSLLSLLCLLWLFFTKRGRQPQKVFISNKKLKKVSYADIFKGTNHFSPDNLIGMGRFGAVYKAVLDVAALPVAIKVFNLEQHGAVKSFCDECKVLKRIRHRNLINVITLCSTIDHSGKEFKALIFEYMPNGSLDKWIHPATYGSQERPLSLGQRINIAMDVAYALDYLHNRCVPALVHCDLKPSNILLDYEMTAHVADFGLTKILHTSSSVQHNGSSMSCGPIGSIGYIAPEYAMGVKNTTEGDVYSYGVLLLQMITGKRPTDEIFKDGLDLHKFAYAAFPGRISEILDPNLLQELSNIGSDSEEQNCAEAWMHGCIIPLIKVGLLCCMELPRQRMRMGDVCTQVAGIKDEYLMSLQSVERGAY
ncbi:unnamed protein product [Urochloa humidicola]